MINISMLVDHCKSRLGVSHRQIELDDDAIVKCLTDTTLKTLSIYAPYYCTMLIDLKKNEVMPGMNTYFVPQELGDDFIVMGVDQVLPFSGLGNSDTSVSTANAGGFSSSASVGMADFFMPSGNDIQGIILSLASMKTSNLITDTTMNPFTFDFLPPNMIRFSGPVGSSKVMMIARTTHKKDFSTFPFGMMETIKDLAFYDVGMDIYSIRKYFTNMRTLFAEINLDMDTFTSIPDKRADLIKDLRRNQLKYGSSKKIYTA